MPFTSRGFVAEEYNSRAFFIFCLPKWTLGGGGGKPPRLPLEKKGAPDYEDPPRPAMPSGPLLSNRWPDTQEKGKGPLSQMYLGAMFVFVILERNAIEGNLHREVLVTL